MPWLIGGGVALLAIIGGVVLWLVLKSDPIEIVSPADGASVSVGDMADGLPLTWSAGGDRVTAVGRLCLTSPDEAAICPFELAQSSRQDSVSWSLESVDCASCTEAPSRQTLVNLANFLAEQAAGQEDVRWALHWKVVAGRTTDVPPIEEMEAVVDITATPALSTALQPEDLAFLGGLE